MSRSVRIGIIICDRYSSCAGGKCFRALRERQGAFAAYAGQEAELVGFTTCGGCPGGNIESAPEEMRKNGAEVVHLATGFLVGYPPCPHLEHFIKMIPQKFGMRVVVGTHPVPQKYYLEHQKLDTWVGPEWKELLAPTIADEGVRLAYD
jgi:predicted metal-binding protein